MRTDNLPQDIESGWRRKVESPALNRNLLRDLQAKADGLEKGMRGIIAVILVSVPLEIFFFLIGSKTTGTVGYLVLLAILALYLLFARDDVKQLRMGLRKLRVVAPEEPDDY